MKTLKISFVCVQKQELLHHDVIVGCFFSTSLIMMVSSGILMIAVGFFWFVVKHLFAFQCFFVLVGSFFLEFYGFPLLLFFCWWLFVC